MITLDQCKYLLALAHHRHFGRAAKEVAIAQPSLSIQIQKIEEMLDTIIFDRSKKPILITTKGKMIIDHARKLMSEAESLMRLKDSTEKISGRFRLAIIPTLSAYLLPLFLESFSRKFPDVQLEVNELQTDQIVKLLKEDRLDAGILVTPLYDNELIERVLFNEPLNVFLSKDHKLKNKKQLKIKDLDLKKLWLMEEGHCLASQTLNLCKVKKESSVFGNVQFKGGSIEVLKNLVRKSGGFTVLPFLSSLELGVKEKKEQLKEFESPKPVREVSIISSRIFYKEEIILALQDQIISNLPKGVKSLKQSDEKVINI